MSQQNYWLLKSEPEEWSWQMQVNKGVEGEAWSGVRNFQARNSLQSMLLGDLCFFYHSGKRKEIVGIVEVSQTYQPDPSDSTGRFGLVWVRAVEALDKPVTLEQMKTEASKASSALHALKLLKQPRLSVMPVLPEEWKAIVGMSKS